jgi:hypothetical protein
MKVVKSKGKLVIVVGDQRTEVENAAIELAQGTTLEGDVPGYIDDATHAARMQTETSRSAERGKTGARAALLTDEAFKAEAIQAWGIDTSGSARKPSAAEVEAIRDQVRKAEVEPLQQKLTAADATVTTMRERGLRDAILTAAHAAKVDPELLAADPNNPDALPPFVAWHVGRFGFDAQTNTHAVVKGKNADGTPLYEYAAKTTAAAPYMGAAEYVSAWASKPENARYLKLDRQQVGGPAAPNASGGGASTIARGDAAAFGANLEAIAKGTVKVAA